MSPPLLEHTTSCDKFLSLAWLNLFSAFMFCPVHAKTVCENDWHHAQLMCHSWIIQYHSFKLHANPCIEQQLHKSSFIHAVCVEMVQVRAMIPLAAAQWHLVFIQGHSTMLSLSLSLCLSLRCWKTDSSYCEGIRRFKMRKVLINIYSQKTTWEGCLPKFDIWRTKGRAQTRAAQCPLRQDIFNHEPRSAWGWKHEGFRLSMCVFSIF